MSQKKLKYYEVLKVLLWEALYKLQIKYKEVKEEATSLWLLSSRQCLHQNLKIML